MEKSSSYQDLEIFKEALALFYLVHPFSFRMPKSEMFELGSQLRRAADSVNSNIVEGYGRRRYKGEFVRYLIMAHSSTLETKVHLEKIGHLYPNLHQEAEQLLMEFDKLGARIYAYVKYVESNWKT